MRGEAAHSYRLGRRHLVCNFLVIVHLTGSSRLLNRYLVVFSDAVDKETFRRLRVALRFPMAPRTKPDNSLVSE